MKEVSELRIADDLRYTQDHEWARQEDGTYAVGISDYAQDQLGDIVFVELPAVGATFSKGQEFGTIESVKVVSELYMPVGGKVVEVNTGLQSAPELVNSDPYGRGWMIRVKPADTSDFETLMTKDAYVAMLKG
ncbi:MAG: glycine cleavage system protein GcvH [Deltaproteobacteria bacterium]|nr:glycine cleavage system protein GcvH [Deltaproteobacteria bacterium]